jgi:NADPH:quinone reductase-like Zn-dependent oxidoreductase
MDKKVLIIGNGGVGLLASQIAEIKEKNPNVEVVGMEEAKERGLSQTFEISAPPIIDEKIYFQPPPTRAERRKQKRKNKKRKK